jgi:hypothetical protein
MRKRPKSYAASWINMTMLAVESQQVIWLRLMKIAGGGPRPNAESNLMVSEKMAAAADAGRKLVLGASPDSVVKGYRKVVRANVRRLSK